MDVSIIIVNYNGLEVLQSCLPSLKRLRSATAFEIILVDNASGDGSVEFVKKEFSDIHVLVNESNAGFGHACNTGAQNAKGKYLLFLNPDTIVSEDFLTPLVSFLEEHSDIGIVCPKIVNEDSSLQLSCGKLTSFVQEAVDKIVYSLSRRKVALVQEWLERKYTVPTEVEWVSGAALMIRAAVFQSLAGFDTNMFMYFEDKDLCKRARGQGWKVFFCPHVSLLHYLGSSSTGSDPVRKRRIYRASQLYYYKKHHGWIQQTLLTVYQKISH
ncbi:MAG TPA: glycosyltransferase family 2 protein [Bacteroidota bacterium]